VSTTATTATTTTYKQPTRRPQPIKLCLSQPKRPNTRLFVRIGIFHKAHQAGAFALFAALKDRLGDNASLLKEVQAVKSRYVLCMNSLEDLIALEKSIDLITQSISDYTIKHQTK
jgi:hypothetical protein